jgi:hypothetical protein
MSSSILAPMARSKKNCTSMRNHDQAEEPTLTITILTAQVRSQNRKDRPRHELDHWAGRWLKDEAKQ